MWDLPQDTYISHASTGRLRLKIPSKKKDSAFFDQLQAGLSTVPGVKQVQANPLSGSLLVLYGFNQLPAEMVTLVSTMTGLDVTGNASQKSKLFYQRFTGAFRQVNTKIKGFTGGELDVPALTFIALVAVGIYQIRKKNFVAPAWYTAFWYALNIFLKAKG